MSVTTPAAGLDMRGRALDAVRTATLEVVLEADGPLRTVDVANLVSAKLGVKLSEEELGGLANLCRIMLDGDSLFAQSNRQWDLALRSGRAEADRRKPVERAVEDFIEQIGHPARAETVAVLTAAVYGRLPEYYTRYIENLSRTRPQFFRTRDDLVGITRWLIDISSDEVEDVEQDNFPDLSVLDAVRVAAAGLTDEDPSDLARAIVRRAGSAVDNKALLFYVWADHQNHDPDEIFNDLWDTEDLRLGRGPAWMTAEAHGQVLAEVRAVVADTEALNEAVSSAAPTEETTSAFAAQDLAVRVPDEDLDQVYEFALKEDRSYRAAELCQLVEVFPGSRRYEGYLTSLLQRLHEDSRFQWVGGERFRLAGSVPMEIAIVPDGLGYDDRDYLDEEGAEIDKMLPPYEWKFQLDESVQHPLVQDLGDDESSPSAKPPVRLEASPPLHHYVAGTLYIRNSDRGFFPSDPDLVQIVLVSADGNRMDAWYNNRLGLLFGLKDWYENNLPWVGGFFTLEKTESSDEYRLVRDGEALEPLMDIPFERLQQLLPLRGDAVAESLPLTQIVLRILKAQPEGLDFVTLFTQVNVVRRVRRAQLASILSGQRYFTQTPANPGIWIYDEKRAQKAQKRKGGPKRPMRGMYDDEDDLDLE